MTRPKPNADPVVKERLRMRFGTVAERFAHKFIPEPMSGCWLWTGKAYSFGHGQLRTGQKWEGAHRVSWRLHRGEIPAGAFVCHKCDVPSCVNPDHLYLGTAVDNARDCEERGRAFHLRGADHPNARFTNEDVRAIRASTEPHGVIARRLGTHKSVICGIRSRRTWRHLP